MLPAKGRDDTRQTEWVWKQVEPQFHTDRLLFYQLLLLSQWCLVGPGANLNISKGFSATKWLDIIGDKIQSHLLDKFFLFFKFTIFNVSSFPPCVPVSHDFCIFSFLSFLLTLSHFLPSYIPAPFFFAFSKYWFISFQMLVFPVPGKSSLYILWYKTLR